MAATRSRLTMWFLRALLGIATLFVVVEAMERWLPLPDLFGGLREIDLVPFLVGVAVIATIATAIHEAGHVVAGRLVGIDFSLVAVGRIGLVATPSGWRLRYLRRSPAGTAGFAVARLTGDESRGQLLFLYAGGPLAGALTALAAREAAFAVDHAGEEGVTGDATLFLSFFAVLSFSSAAANLLPIAGFDGAKILRAITSSGQPRNAQEAAEIELDALFSAGRRPGEWPLDVLSRLFPEPVPVGELLRYWALLDRGDIDAAGEHLDRAVTAAAAAPQIARAAIWVEKCYFTALHRAQPEAAQRAIERARREPGLVDPCTWLRAEAAILLAQGRRREAFEKAEAGIDALRYSGEGAQAIDKPLLERLVLVATKGTRAA